MAYPNLRTANDARHIEWDKDDASTHSFSATELAGEMGEALAACYIDQTDTSAIAEELADTAICLDLVARRFDILLPIPSPPPVRAFNTVVSALDGVQLAAEVGFACNIVKKLEREELGMVGSRATAHDLTIHLRRAMGILVEIADKFGIDLHHAIAAKFNKTSAKYGLSTMMELS